MSDKFTFSEAPNPESWDLSIDWQTIEFPNAEMAKEMAKRWNAYEQLRAELKQALAACADTALANKKLSDELAEAQADIVYKNGDIKRLTDENERLESEASDLGIELEERKEIFDQRGKANVAMAKKIAELEAKLKGAVDRKKINSYIDKTFTSVIHDKLGSDFELLKDQINSHRLDVDYE